MLLRSLKKAVAVIAACSLLTMAVTANAATMLEAKSQQSALESQKEENSRAVTSLKEDVDKKRAYIKRLKKNIQDTQKDMDLVNNSLIKLDKATEGKDETEIPKAVKKSRENLLRQKDEYSFILADFEELKKEAELLLTTSKEEQEAAKAEEKRIAEEQKKTDEAIDAWYQSYRQAQIDAGSSIENLGGDVLSGKGQFVWPMPGYTYITQYFVGDHRGIDIAGGDIYGKAIVSSAKGTVVYSDWMDSYGYVVFIDHGNGYQTRYAHMSALGCDVGDAVEANQVIGYVGSTGNSTGPHLHFEVIYDGSINDPFNYF